MSWHIPLQFFGKSVFSWAFPERMRRNRAFFLRAPRNSPVCRAHEALRLSKELYFLQFSGQMPLFERLFAVLPAILAEMPPRSAVFLRKLAELSRKSAGLPFFQGLSCRTAAVCGRKLQRKPGKLRFFGKSFQKLQKSRLFTRFSHLRQLGRGLPRPKNLQFSKKRGVSRRPLRRKRAFLRVFSSFCKRRDRVQSEPGAVRGRFLQRFLRKCAKLDEIQGFHRFFPLSCGNRALRRPFLQRARERVSAKRLRARILQGNLKDFSRKS